MIKNTARPYAGSRLAKYIDLRIRELKPRKTQGEIAAEAGFRQPSILAMFKNGATKLPLDRVAGLAKALECDPAMLFRMALEQLNEDATALAIDQIFGTIITKNERDWLTAIRDASENTDPSLTARAQKVIRAIFGK